MNSNDYLILAGTLHSVFAIASQCTPKAIEISSSSSAKAESQIPYIPGIGVKTDSKSTQSFGSFMPPDYFQDSFATWSKTGLKHLITDEFALFLFQSLTGLKIILISTNTFRNNTSLTIAENILRKIYCIYSDYVMKDPFYSIDMPIRSKIFESKLTDFVQNL